MPGRDDYGALRSSALTDPRFHSAADAYVKAGLSHDDVAIATVCGHVAMLGLWCMRETDDGVLPGDGVWAFHQATFVPRSECPRILGILRVAGLLKDTPRGLYVTGFNDCYASIIRRRTENRELAREKRKARGKKTPKLASKTEGCADVTPTSAPRCADVDMMSGTSGAKRSGAERIEDPPPTSSPEDPPLTPRERGEPPADAEEPEPEVVGDDDPPANGRPLRPRHRDLFARKLEYVVRCGPSRDQNVALARRARYRSGKMPDDEIRSALAEMEWVTREKLAKFEEHG